jgi:hypothetical protein
MACEIWLASKVAGTLDQKIRCQYRSNGVVLTGCWTAPYSNLLEVESVVDVFNVQTVHANYFDELV